MNQYLRVFRFSISGRMKGFTDVRVLHTSFDKSKDKLRILMNIYKCSTFQYGEMTSLGLL